MLEKELLEAFFQYLKTEIYFLTYVSAMFKKNKIFVYIFHFLDRQLCL
jgi:hypothetical protein